MHRIIEAGTYLNGLQYVFPDWGNASFLNARACYVSGECILAGEGDASNAQITAVSWNDTQTLYTRSYVDEDQVWVAYVEEPFTI
jgi:hypothetical protein